MREGKEVGLMVITCPHCKKKYEVEEKKLTDTVTKARCRECGKTFSLKTQKEESGNGGNGRERKQTRPRTIGVSLSKGGVGKSTTAVNLAAGLAMAGKKVLLVDTDTQGQDSFMLGVKPVVGLTELVTGELTAKEVLCRARENLWLLAGGKSLAGLKRMIDRKDFGGELTLKEALEPLEKDFDYVIVDTSPGWDPLTVNVLFYVHDLLTPVSLEVMTLQGLGEFLKSLSAIRKYRKDIHLKYILPTFHDKRIKQTGKILSKIKEIYPKLLCPEIRYNVRLSEAPAYGKSIYEYAPGSNGAHDYRQLVRTVTGQDNLLR